MQKQNIVNLSSLAGAISAGIAEGNGNSTKILTTANQGGEIGKRAVENNFFEQAYKSADYTNGLFANEKTKQDIEQVKKDVTQVLREEHPVIAMVGDGIYAVGSATGKVIYVSREVLLQVAPIILAPEIAGGLKVGQAIQLAAKYPKVAEAIIAGGVSTGFDVYNGEANYEKTLANFALAGIVAETQAVLTVFELQVKVSNSCGLETLAIVGNNQAVAEGQNSTALIILNKVRK